VNDQLDPPVQVAVCIPSGRTWESETSARIAAICMRAMSNGIRLILVNESNSVISFSRNSMAEFALNNGATHIMWIDSDNIPPVDVIKRFVDLDKDIVGSVYCKRVPPYELLGVPAGPVDFSRGGVVPYWLLPGGCVMVKAKVYRTIPKPWYFESIRREGSPMEAFMSLLNDHYRLPIPDNFRNFLEQSPALSSWLSSEEEENRTRYGNSVNTGEDVNFCMKAHLYGFEAWCDLDSSYETGHIGIQTIYPGKPQQKEQTSGND
jgi:hypothetical protein